MENVLVMTDAFAKFSVAVVTPDIRNEIVVKALVSRSFHNCGIFHPEHIATKGKIFDNNFKERLCKLVYYLY